MTVDVDVFTSGCFRYASCVIQINRVIDFNNTQKTLGRNRVIIMARLLRCQIGLLMAVIGCYHKGLLVLNSCEFETDCKGDVVVIAVINITAFWQESRQNVMANEVTTKIREMRQSICRCTCKYLHR